MAPPGKAAALAAQEQTIVPTDQRDMSRRSPAPAPVAAPPSLVPQQGPLSPFGVHLSTPEVNQHVEQIVQAHTTKFGHKPTPGLVFDLLRATAVLGPNPDYSGLFAHVPASKRDAFANSLTAGTPQGSQVQHMTYERPDGLIVHPSAPGLPASDTLHSLHKEFPTVQMGMLPLSDANKVYQSLNDLANTPDNLKVTSLGQSLQEATKIQELSGGRSDLQSIKLTLTGQQAVQTIKQAQVDLNDQMGTKLPITGFMNADWQKALGNWMKTREYFTRVAQQQATEAGFKNYGTYLKAFKTKESMVHKHGLFAQFLNALPVSAFEDGPWQIATNLIYHPFANPTFSASYPLHAVSRLGSDAFRVVGGTVNQGKADAAAGSAFIDTLDKTRLQPGGMDFEEAKKKAQQALVQNPTWMRVFMPNLPTDKNTPEWLKGTEELTNFVGDFLLLRKPAFTGERVEPGAVAAAKRSPYVNRSSEYAHAYVKKGDLYHAANLLEGGDAAEQLVAVTTQSVKKGWMSPEVFVDHVAELYAKGKTTVTILKPEKDTVIPVYHGTDVTAPLKTDVAESGRFGHVTFVTPEAEYANSYANVRAIKNAAGLNARTDAEQLGEGSTPNVRLHKVDTSKLYPFDPARNKIEVDTPRLIKRVLAKLTPEEKTVSENLETYSLAEVKDPMTLYAFLRTVGSRMETNSTLSEAERGAEASIPETGTYGSDFANEVLQRAGFTGIQEGREIAVFNPEKSLLPRFEQPRQVEVHGSLLPSLRSGHIPTSPRAVKAKDVVVNKVDAFDKGARQSGTLGNLAADFTSYLRTEFGHEAPTGARAAYDPKLPERVHAFVMKHFQDAELANKTASMVVKARSTQNTPKLEKIMQGLQRAYYKKYEAGPGTLIEDDPFSPMLESEAGSRLYFPGGNFKNPTNPFETLEVTAQRVNRGLNKIGGPLRRVLIISPALAWKHAVGDTLRRIIGGDIILDAEAVSGRKMILDYANSDVTAARRWGTALDRVENGEAFYMASPGEKSLTYRTGDHFDSKPHMTAAGRELRVMLDDRAYEAFLKSTPDDVSPIVDLIEHNRVYRRLWSGKQKEKALEKYGKQSMENKVHVVDVNQGLTLTRGQMLKNAFSSEDYARAIFNRYKQVQEAAYAQGTHLEDARTVLRNNRGGHADEKLGEWAADNKVDFKVEKGLVSGYFSFDSVTSKVIQKIMFANKANRRGMFQNIAGKQFKALKEAGWDDADALSAATHVAEKQTIYHMLDFSNRLQIEQDLRWLSYFATKHRLYWKWAAATAVRNPFAAAALTDVKQHLDSKGNLNFTIFGHKLLIPAARLLWVNSREYPEESPIAQGLVAAAKDGFSVKAFANAAAGDMGSGFSRDAVPATMIVRAARMEFGSTPSTYYAATSGMDETNKRYFNREVNHFQMDYFAEHGHYAPESDAIKHSLWSLAWQNLWRANLPGPVLPQNPNEMQKLVAQFMAIDDPLKRSQFLDAHPEVQAQFGVSQNPSDYLHYRTFWSQFTQALDLYHAERDKIYQEAKVSGMTPELDKRRHLVSDAFRKTFENLKAQDRRKTPIPRQKEMNGEMLGLWGQQVSADPLANPRKTLTDIYPNITNKELNRGIPGDLVKNARAELNLLNDPAWVKKTFDDPAEARTRKRELIQFIDDFQPFSHDALGKLQEDYITKHVNPYWTKVEQFNAQIQKMGRGAKDLGYARLRAWKDQQSEPVVVDGVKFPPPIVMAWASMPPDIRRQRLASLATGSWSNLADYEKKLLGVKTPDFTSYGYEKLLEERKKYAHDNPGHSLDRGQVLAIVGQIDKAIPGFKKDWQFSQKPKIEVFEATNAYKDMTPHVKEWWDTIVGKNAHTLSAAYYDKNGSSTDRANIYTTWEDAVQKQIVPALQSDPQVKRWLEPYLTANPDFLNTIIKQSNG